MKFENNEHITNLEYVLKFALHVIEENGLENEMSAENWTLGESIEEQIKFIREED